MNSTATLSRTSKLHLNFDARLSERESEICEQVILGHTQMEASELFHLSPFTISQTIRNSFRKTGARNISELGVWHWCKKFNVTMVISDRMRKIIPVVLLALFLTCEFTPTTELKSRRNRRGRGEYDYEFICEDFDFTEPILPLL